MVHCVKKKEDKKRREYHSYQWIGVTSERSILTRGVLGVRDWNEEFQRLKERENSSHEHNAELERLSELRKLCEEFASVAREVG